MAASFISRSSDTIMTMATMRRTMRVVMMMTRVVRMRMRKTSWL